MKAFRHKTQHKKFKYGVPALLALHVVLAVRAVARLSQVPVPIGDCR